MRDVTTADDGGEQQSQTVRALLQLREMLLSGAFAPGERVSELPLVDRLGVSRTPVRLALLQLEHEGLLQARPTGGYAMRAFDRRDVHDALELRGVLEGTAARLAAERLESPDALAGMALWQDQMEAALAGGAEEGFLAYVELNDRFHARLVELSGSPLLRRSLDQVVALPFAAPSAFVRAQVSSPASHDIMLVALTQHRDLLEAVGAREGARAEALGREHARLARRHLDLVSADSDLLDRLPGSALLRVLA